jgi:RNA polymerase sigma-70 factor, ECF subfamily
MRWSDEQFTAVFNELHPGLCRYLECMLGRSGAAQEIAQESFLRLFREGSDRIARGEERYWVYRVASNLARNELRRRRIRDRLADVLPALVSRAPNPHEEAERSEADRALVAALARLPEQRRAAVLLREQEGLRYDEIARVLGVSIAKVKVDIFRGRDELRRLLAPLGAGAGGRAESATGRSEP